MPEPSTPSVRARFPRRSKRSRLKIHPHVHCVVPVGGLSLDLTRWVRSRDNYFFPKEVLREIFRGKFVDALEQAFTGRSETPRSAQDLLLETTLRWTRGCAAVSAPPASPNRHWETLGAGNGTARLKTIAKAVLVLQCRVLTFTKWDSSDAVPQSLRKSITKSPLDDPKKVHDMWDADTYMTEAAFSALADPTRRAVLDLLLRGSLPVGRIAQRFQSLDQPFRST